MISMRAQNCLNPGWQMIIMAQDVPEKSLQQRITFAVSVWPMTPK